MRKLIAVIVVAILPFAAFGASSTKGAAIHQLLTMLNLDSGDESPDSRFAVFDRTMTEPHIRETMTFFSSASGQQFLASMGALNNAQVAELKQAMERSRVKRTAADMRTLATALEARATDTNSYPEVKTLDELGKLVMPVYIRTMPRVDGWSHEFLYLGAPQHYRIVSAGPDGKFAEASRRRSAKSGFGDDLVFEDGVFIAAPDYIMQ